LSVYFKESERVNSYFRERFLDFYEKWFHFFPNQNIPDSELVSIFREIQKNKNLVLKMQIFSIASFERLNSKIDQKTMIKRK